MRFTGITKRWAINVASIVLVILLIVSLFAFALVRNYYYGTAELFIENYDTNDISSVFSLYGASDTGFEDAARGYVENFSNKDHVAVWVIDSSGKVIATSSGFSISENVNMPDFNSAVKNETGTDRWTGKLPSGEKIMASTNVYRYSDGSLGGGIRFMVSLDAVDQQLARIALLIFFTAVLMFAVLMISGMVFIKSIVNPSRRASRSRPDCPS